MPDRLTEFVRGMVSGMDDPPAGLIALSFINWLALGLTLLLTGLLETAVPSLFGALDTVVFGYVAIATGLWGYRRATSTADEESDKPTEGTSSSTASSESAPVSVVRYGETAVVETPRYKYKIVDTAVYNEWDDYLAEIDYGNYEIEAPAGTAIGSLKGSGVYVLECNGTEIAEVDHYEATTPDGQPLVETNGSTDELDVAVGALIAERKLR